MKTQIRIKLHANRRHDVQIANRHKLIAGENLSTAIRVEFPQEFKDHHKRVDFLNEQGEKWTIGLFTPEYNEYDMEFDRLNLRFKLPHEITLDGELHLQAEVLKQRQVARHTGKTNWDAKQVERILSDEKYSGDIFWGKTSSPDIMLDRRANEEPLAEILNNHVGIVTRETFKKAQVEIERRRIDQMNLTADRGRYSSKYAFSGRLECECGSKFRRYSQTFRNKDGEVQIRYVWVCITHQKRRADCPMKPIAEQSVEDAFVRAVNRLVEDKSRYMDILTKNLETVVGRNIATSPDELRQRIEVAQLDLIQASKEGQNEKVAMLIAEIQAMQNNLEIARIDDKGACIHITKLNEAKRLLGQPLKHFNDLIFRSQVQRVIVIAENTRPTALKFVLFGTEIVEPLA